MDHNRSLVDRPGCWCVQFMCRCVSLRSETLSACRPNSDLCRVDWLHDGDLCSHPGHWETGTLLAFNGVLEHAFPTLGSNHVRHPISDRAVTRDNADPGQPGVATQALSQNGSNDGTCPSLCSNP